MTPEEIEYVREWATGSDRLRFSCEVDEIVPAALWQMLDKDDDSFCELTTIGLAIAAQAERIRELETENALLKISKAPPLPRISAMFPLSNSEGRDEQ